MRECKRTEKITVDQNGQVRAKGVWRRTTNEVNDEKKDNTDFESHSRAYRQNIKEKKQH